MTDTAWISLSFDDALDQHLDVALPAIDAYRLPGNFTCTYHRPRFFDAKPNGKQPRNVVMNWATHRLPSCRGNKSLGSPRQCHRLLLPRSHADGAGTGELLLEFAGSTHGANVCLSLFELVCRSTGLGSRRTAAIGMGPHPNCRLDATVFISILAASGSPMRPLIGELFRAGRAGGLERRDNVPPVSTWDRTCLLSKAVGELVVDRIAGPGHTRTVAWDLDDSAISWSRRRTPHGLRPTGLS